MPCRKVDGEFSTAYAMAGDEQPALSCPSVPQPCLHTGTDTDGSNSPSHCISGLLLTVKVTTSFAKHHLANDFVGAFNRGRTFGEIFGPWLYSHARCRRLMSLLLCS